MDEKALVLKFWEREGRTTRKVIARIPEGSDYRPDARSRTAREIAWVLTDSERVLVEGLERGRMVFEQRPAPPTIAEVLSQFDRQRGPLIQRLRGLPSSNWERKIPFEAGGQQIMNETGYEYAWMTLFDLVHHRGQLSSYLRAMGSTVPSIYGPSADEQWQPESKHP
jgi:uncharacterized damage-inducible protein DinB